MADPAIAAVTGPRVWLCDTPAPEVQAPPAWFSAAEQARWAGLGDARKGSFLQSRTLLRALLGAEYGGGPVRWPLDGRGRPMADSGAPVMTSLSHEGDAVMVAVMQAEGGLGVDLDHPRPDCRWRQIARRWFAPGETSLLQSLQDDPAERLFYRLWTLKEAWVKATGRGLAGHFQAIQATDGPAPGWRLQADTRADDWQALSAWHGSACLAVIWRGSPADRPRIEHVALDGDGVPQMETPVLTEVFQTTLEPLYERNGLDRDIMKPQMRN